MKETSVCCCCFFIVWRINRIYFLFCENSLSNFSRLSSGSLLVALRVFLGGGMSFASSSLLITILDCLGCGMMVFWDSVFWLFVGTLIFNSSSSLSDGGGDGGSGDSLLSEIGRFQVFETFPKKKMMQNQSKKRYNFRFNVKSLKS